MHLKPTVDYTAHQHGRYLMAKSLGGRRTLLFLALVLSIVGVTNLASVPLWWDEGWTLSVARTWVENGHYGRLLAGEIHSARLTGSFTVVAPIALSFDLLGVGVWQGRLPGALYTVGALLLMFDLVRRLADRRTAFVTLNVLLLLSGHPEIHPLVVGRQVLAEMPMLFWLMGGYLGLLLALRRSIWFLLPTTLFFGIGLVTKAQPLPFWVLSLLLPLSLLLWQRRWHSAFTVVIALVGALLVREWLPGLFFNTFVTSTVSSTPTEGLYQTTAFVLEPHNRVVALKRALYFALPTALGLAWAGYRWWRQGRSIHLHTPEATVTLMLWVMAASWYGWYLSLSVGFTRYLAPAVFMGSLFVALWLRDLTDGYQWRSSLVAGVRRLRRRQAILKSVGGALVFALLLYSVGLSVLSLTFSYVDWDEASGFSRTVHYLNTQTPVDALIETYDSELHFLLERPYHYPPDQIHVELNRRTYLRQDVPIPYDPLAADPDYLVVGTYSRRWQLYEPVLGTDDFRLVETHGSYQIYERVRKDGR